MSDFSVLDYVTSGVCILDARYTVLFWNARLEKWTRVERDTVLGRDIRDFFPGFGEDAYRKRLEGLFSGGPPVLFSSQLHGNLFHGFTPKGESAVQQATVRAYPDGSGGFYALFSIEDVTALSRKITDYRRMSETARSALEEKDILFREMHHRIHNNLNTVVSLIDLKISDTGNAEDLRDLRNQVNAIRLVHEKLYRGGNAMEIELGPYLEEMIRTVLSFYVDMKVCLNIDIPDMTLDTERAIPLGLIVNEVVINSLKHGYDADQEAGIAVGMTCDTVKGEYVLTAGNNGRPIPDNVGLENPGTLGLRLIASLTKQLRGRVDLVKAPHPRFIIRF